MERQAFANVYATTDEHESIIEVSEPFRTNFDHISYQIPPVVVPTCLQIFKHVSSGISIYL